MDTVEAYRDHVERILLEYAAIPYAYGELQCEAVFDRSRDRYMLITLGWDQGKRVHHSLVHVDIVDGKLWIQRDGLELGMAAELVNAGVPRDKIVLAYKPPEVRRLTEFAVA